MHRFWSTRPWPLLALAPLLLLSIACGRTSSSVPDGSGTAASPNDAIPATAQAVTLANSRHPDQLFPPCNRYDNAQDFGPLPALGETVQRPFTESYEAHRYTFDVEAGDYVHVVVEQQNVDLVVSLVDEAGQGLLRVDSLYGHRGTEEVHWIEEQGGQRALLVCADVDIHEGAGYSVRIQEQAPPSQEAEALSEAFLVYHTAEAHRRRGTGPSRHEALQLFHEAADLWSHLGRDHDVALAIYGIGRVHADLQDDYATAEKYVLQGIQLLEESGDRFLVGASRHRLATIKEFTGKHREAVYQYEEALRIRREIDHFKGQISTLTNLALVHTGRGDFDKAQSCYHEAIEVSKIKKFLDKEADLLRSLGDLNHTLGNYETALTSITEALDIHLAINNPVDISSTLFALGRIYQTRREFQKAIGYFQRAHDYYVDLGDRLNITRSLIWKGDAEIELRDYESALRTFTETLALALDYNLRPEEAKSRMFLGWIKAETGDCPGAILDFEEAARGFEEAQDFRTQALIFQNIAICQKWLGNTQEALRYALRSTVLSEHKRERALSMSWQSKFFAGGRTYFDFLIDVLVELADGSPLRRQYLQQALETSERSKARTLLDAITLRSLGNHQSALLEEQTHELKESLNRRLSYKLITSPSHHALQTIDSETRFELERLERTIRELLSESNSDQPESAGEILDVAEIRDLLGDDTTLLEFHVGYWQSHLWLVDSEKTLHFKLPNGRDLDSILTNTYRNLSSKARPVQTQMLLQDVSQLIFGDALKYIETEKIIIVKDGPLHYLPLDALFSQNKSSKASEGTNRHRLGDRFEIISVPSMSVLAKIRQIHQSREAFDRNIAVFADPVFNLDDPRIHLQVDENPDESRSDSTYTGQLERLNFSENEANWISRIATQNNWSVRTSLGFDALASSVNQDALSGTQILHLATHADFHSRQPEFAYLAFSAFEESGRPSNDGFLFAYELYSREINAELVVLSACSSALGSNIQGEGLVGLTQGFLQSGAAQVLVSLWQVDDRASAELMQHFYRAYLGEGLRPSKALWKAKMTIKDQTEWSDPYYWAGFSLIGDWIL